MRATGREIFSCLYTGNIYDIMNEHQKAKEKEENGGTETCPTASSRLPKHRRSNRRRIQQTNL